ncbi:glycosyltransferase [Marinobacter sp. CHS3-4]|uniref:glycosyltransferase n=1 Tax=Marinobacter sp. CHS3-4 TaxID=3045174 RepID=UPI0024B614A4|nr:glycosyltransferase [Marinobacter sp. CHS3-4]MDI9245579.1 glycosyltransferase [Marinobacter sp. CHS3-4]
MKRALVISYHFLPDQSVGAKRPTELVNSMLDQGWHVTVLSRAHKTPLTHDEYQGPGTLEIVRAPHLPGILNPSYNAFKRLIQAVRRAKKEDDRPDNEPIEKDSISETSRGSVSFRFWLKRLVISWQAMLNATKGWLVSSLVLLVVQKIKGKQFDVVISSSPPASVHFLARFALFLFGGRWILDVRDPINMWELVVPVCRAPYRVCFENWLERSYLRRADQIVVTTDPLKEEMLRTAERCGYKYGVTTVYNGFDGELIRERAPSTKTAELAFAGELYANRNPFPLLNAINDLLKSGEIETGGIRFHLYGNCETWNGYSLREWAQKNGLEDTIILHGMLPPDSLETELRQAHLLVSYAQQQPLQIPAKTFDYLRYPCSSFVITEKDSATGQFVIKNDVGYASDDDPTCVRQTLLLALRDLNRHDERGLSQEDRAKRQSFSRSAQNRDYLDLIRNFRG